MADLLTEEEAAALGRKPLSDEEIKARIANSGCAGSKHWEEQLRDVLRCEHRKRPFKPARPHWHSWVRRYLSVAPNGQHAD